VPVSNHFSFLISKEIDMRGNLILAAGVVFGMLMIGCQSSHEEGVKSNYVQQWTDVSTDPATTADAAKAVLMDEGLRDVKSNATGVDGTAEGKKADGTKVKVSIKKKDTGSQVSVMVGTMGDPALGAEVAKKIKMRAERR
jgi:hypothetical protein